MYAVAVESLPLREVVEEGSHRRVRGLAVEVSGELVVLRGRCDSYHVKQLAQEAALKQLPAGWRLENRIEVGEASPLPVFRLPLPPARLVRPRRITGRPLLVRIT